MAAIAAEALMSASTIVPLAILAEVTAPSRISEVVTASAAILSEVTASVARRELVTAVSAILAVVTALEARRVSVTVPVSAAVMAVPEIFVFAMAAEALMSALTIVPSTIIVLVTVPVSVVLTRLARVNP